MININVYSDLSCPWCYVGKRRLDKAIQQFSPSNITVNWHPYIIDKNTAQKGEEYMSYNIRRWCCLKKLLVASKNLSTMECMEILLDTLKISGLQHKCPFSYTGHLFKSPGQNQHFKFFYVLT